MKVGGEGRIGYYAQDHAADFAEDMSLTDWISASARQRGYGGDCETLMRGTLGRLLFSGDEVKKSVKVISGGEQGRMLFGKLMLQRPNVLVMDEPTNHLDMESIESLNTALEKFPGTLIFVSHDREFDSISARKAWIDPRGDSRACTTRGEPAAARCGGRFAPSLLPSRVHQASGLEPITRAISLKIELNSVF
jgi:ATPase subunit of ABC transporter with duplicated ATPase domains